MIAYRDHPPQDHTYVTKTTPLNPDIQVTKDALAKLYASGGGDGPEAVTAAMAEVLRLVSFDQGVDSLLRLKVAIFSMPLCSFSFSNNHTGLETKCYQDDSFDS